jgi:dTDP-4-dehydrorhamnose reductase
LRVLVTGAGGLVGRAVVGCCEAQGDFVVACDHRGLEITDHRYVVSTLERERPEVVINCAAWTDVDGCQNDLERARNINARGPAILASACRGIAASFITISTDYVFRGDKEGFYSQRDDPDPISVYGATKLEGERRAQSAYARTSVVRTGFVFGVGGNNFLSTVVERARRGDHIRAIDDCYGTPTAALDLAARLRHLAGLDLPGVYHVVNGGDGTSYFDFARAVIALLGEQSVSVEGVCMEELDRPAPRPRNSRLRCLVSEAIGLPPLPDWREALKKFVSAPAASAIMA